MINVYKKLINYVPEKKHLLFLTIFFSIASAVIQIVAFYYLYEFLKNLIVQGNTENAKNYAIIIAVSLSCGGLIYLLSLVVSHLFAFRLETNLRKFGIDGLTKASFRFFDINSSGRTRKLLDDNAAQTHMSVAHLIPDNTGAVLMPILVLTLGFFISVRVGIALLVLALASMIMMKLMMGEKEFLKIYQGSLEKLSAETVEYIRGMQVVKIFGVDVRSFKALNSAIKEYAKYASDYSQSCRRPYVLFQEMFLGISAILVPIILLFININVDPKGLAVELIMVFFLSGVLFIYIMKVMYLSMYTFQAKDAVEKLENLYDEMQKDSLLFGAETNFANYDIEFNNVSFGYTDNKLILENVSLKLQEGKSYALVGASGSGKSTMAKLISGFYKINAGEIKIGGMPLTNYTKEAIIKNIAFVFQDAKLFKISLYDNVAIAKKSADKEEVMQAMHMAGCDNIIAKFKDKENTLIGSKGVHLSGGEKQRIAIARAILKNAKIIIFDEASAAVDPDNEHQLQKAFANLMKDKTVIMIAHRLTTIENMDEIIVLENGKIVERGTNEKLMQINSIYKHFQDVYKEANDWRVLDEEII